MKAILHQLSHAETRIAGYTLVDQPFDPALFPNHDRAPRSGELEKPWATLELGAMKIDRGITKLVLSADRMPGTQVMEVREVILERVFTE